MNLPKLEASDKALWYVAQVQSGTENTVVKAIKEQAEKRDMEKYFEEILVPTKKVTEVKKGKKVSSDKKFFPGYILIKMIMTNETWQLVKRLPRVNGFLGSKNKPVPISENEALRLLNRIEESKTGVDSAITYEVGEEVKVIEGPFNSFTGIVEAVEDDKKRLKVSVSIFGRPTQVELGFEQVEKI
jgi:transcriptional antiterminator NusG